MASNRFKSKQQVSPARLCYYLISCLLLLSKVILTSVESVESETKLVKNQTVKQHTQTSGGAQQVAAPPPSPLNNLKPLIQAALAVAPKQQPPTSAQKATSNQQQQQQSSGKQRPVQANGNAQAQVKAATSSAADGQSPAALYGPGTSGSEEPVIKLDYSSINDEILRKRTANFVYFNANFNTCRHCYKFYSIWRELALDIRWWRQVIKLFAINCSDDDNIEVCRKAGVTQFPQVRFYWIMSQSLEQDGQRMRILGKSVHAMRHLIMDRVLDSYTEHKQLVQRAQQQRSGAVAAGGSSAASNPLQALMPILTQMFAPSPASGGASSGLGGLMGALLGGGGGGIGVNHKQASGQQQMPLAGLLGGGALGFQGITDMINALAGVASWRKSLTIQPMPNNWPDFEQIDVGGDTQRLLDWLPLDPVKGVGALLVMETQEFLYTGLETMLDLSPYSNSTYLARVRDERSLLSRNLTKRDDVQAPALIYITETREPRLLITAPKFTNDEDLRRAFVRTFERRQVKYPVKRVWSRLGSSPSASAGQLDSPLSSDSQEDEDILGRLNQVYMSDLLNTIRASLMEQVFRHPDLSDDQYNALVKYVYALINYFPFTDDQSFKFFKRLHSWLQNQVSPMDISEYKKQFHDIDEVLGKRREWIACKSLSNTKAIPTKSRKSAAGLLFENPSQLGKVVSNITRLFRANQQKAGQLKSLIGMFTSNLAPVVMLGNSSSSSSNAGAQRRFQGSTTSSTTSAPANGNEASSAGPTSTASTGQSAASSSEAAVRDQGGSKGNKDKEESPIERLFSSLSNGSLGSDSSILKLISTALTGGSSHNDTTTSGKSKFSREYPCGAWKLAHVMVVNEYIKDSPRKDVKHIVLHSLYQYMLHFYACATCGNRVSDVSGEFKLNLDDHLSEQGDSIMLLWKMHNRVNKRLESEIRPGSPTKQQFPSESLCAKCRAPKAQNDIVSTPNWHEKQVLAFLVHHYRPQSIIQSSDSGASSSSSDSSPSPIINGRLNTLLVAACSLLATLAHLSLVFSRF